VSGTTCGNNNAITNNSVKMGSGAGYLVYRQTGLQTGNTQSGNTRDAGTNIANF